jgi:hypothetical protein
MHPKTSQIFIWAFETQSLIVPAMPTASANTRRNWSRSHRMSFWQLALQSLQRCYRQHARMAPDPVANGFVASLAQPGGNVTGFTTFDLTPADASSTHAPFLKMGPRVPELGPAERQSQVHSQTHSAQTWSKKSSISTTPIAIQAR